MSLFTRSYPLLRRAAPRLSKDFFTCQQYVRVSPLKRASNLRSAKPSIPFFQHSRWASTQTVSTVASLSSTSSLPLASLSRTFGAKANAKSFPDVSKKIVAYWLLGSAASVFGIVIFGGLTRLTESGLSITEWKPVTGSLPPMSIADWESEFEKYKATPEFALLNSRITLDEFKQIYWMEWIHRLWGRFIGLTFVLPAAYFVARKQVSRPMAWKLLGIGGLIGFQGFVGWWMVASGLKDDLFAPGSHPRVSQYRLTAHLATAIATYTAMLWQGLRILRAQRFLASPRSSNALLTSLNNPSLRSFKISAGLFTFLTLMTVLSGGFVAGLDAGLIYNEFPKMGLGLTPPMSELFSTFYTHKPDNSDLIWRNMLENPSLVQLEHRILGTTTFVAAIALFAYARTPAMKRLLPASARKGAHGILGFAALQFTLGLLTLLYMVPTSMASAHQANALALFTWSVLLGSRVWKQPSMARLVSRRMATLKSHSTITSKQFQSAARKI